LQHLWGVRGGISEHDIGDERLQGCSACPAVSGASHHRSTSTTFQPAQELQKGEILHSHRLTHAGTVYRSPHSFENDCCNQIKIASMGVLPLHSS
jgi:hypothetical protein